MIGVARGVALALGLALPMPAVAADITGLWSTGSQGGRVLIYACGSALCGKIVDAAAIRANPDQRDVRNADPSLRSRRLRNLIVLNGFVGGPTEWNGGPVYDPETGDGANTGFIKLRPDGRLEIKGCVAFFCRTKIWSRSPR